MAAIWADLLGVERIGRDDDFFELGGHSLLAVSLVERMREAGLTCDVRAVFTTPTVAGLATAIAAGGGTDLVVPPNAIPADAEAITPDMLPLVTLTEEQITQVVSTVPGGAGNVQDIYPLAPLQEGIFFHHLMGDEGDAYLLSSVSAVPSREWVGQFANALQTVVDRHDILRTSVVREGLPHPVQVVWRRTELLVEEVTLDGSGDATAELLALYDPRRFHMDLGAAPLLRVVTAYDEPNDRWLLMVLMHHMVGDHTTLDVVQEEIGTLLNGAGGALPEPVPYRNVVAQAVLGTSREEHEEFFTGLLGDVDEPTAPYGLLNVRGDGTAVAEAQVAVEAELAGAIREQARRAGVSPASVCHLAWSLVLSRLTGRSDVVFGTVVFGRMQAGAGAERGLGLFINTLPIRIGVGAQGALDAVRDTHGLLADVLRHEHAPLVLAQGSSQVPTGLPLFTSLLNYRHSAPADPNATGAALSGLQVLHSEERTNYPVVVSVDDLGSEDAGFAITAQVDDRLDPGRVCGLLTAALRELTETLADDPAASVSAVEALPAAERALVVEGFNATEAPFDPTARLHERFEAHAKATPDAIAMTHGDTQLTYRDLNAKANQVAHRLRTAGVGPDVRVGICARRGVPLLTAMLGVLKAGGAYVPMDPSFPAERTAFMLADARPTVVLTDGVELPTAQMPVIDLASLADEPQTDLPNLAASTDMAYVLYTSGSTGLPKGVAVEHRSIIRLVVNNPYVDFTPDDRTAFAANPSFDAATWEIWGPLTNGGTIVVIDQDTFLNPRQLATTLAAHGVTGLFTTTALFNQTATVVPDAFAGLRYLFTGGERCDPAAFTRILDSGAAPQRLIHCYGPTETTTFATTHDVTHVTEGQETLPIGAPIGNTHIYIVDGHGRPVPVGVTGELFIGGLGVARGYLGRPALTAERFVPDWLTGDGTRLYRTGDLGRWLPDGTIEFIGRNDFQVKVRGYRIELGEIEARLLEHHAIREAIVIARDDRLNAYYVADTRIDAATLRTTLDEVLPSYMVPSAFVALDALPLTPNGKVDRDKLPTPDGDAVVARGYQPPVGPVEEELAAIWADLLGVERIGRDDDFFELGGHSLLAVSLVEQMRQAGLSCDVRAVFTTPTIAGLATAVAAGGGTEVQVPPNAIPADADTITPAMLPLVELTEDHIATVVSTVPGGARNLQDIYPLAPLQEGIFFHHLMGGEGDAYLLSSVSAVPSREWIGDFASALQTVVDRHDILRTAVVGEGLPQPVQVVWRHVEAPVEEVTLDADEDAVTQLLARFDPRRYRLDLEQAPLLRVVTAYDEPNDRWLLMVLMHHLIGDHTTLDVVQKEIGALLTGHAAALPEPVPYRNVVAQAVLGTSRKEHEEFFSDLLGEVDEPTAPYGLLDVRGDGTGIAEAQATVETELADAIREQARRAGVSSASVCHLAWSMVLSRLTGRSDVVFGTVLFGRMQAGAGAERGIGLFINTLPVRVEVGAQGALDAVRDTHGLLAEVLRHEHAPLVVAQRCSQVPPGSPLFTTLLNYRHSAESTDLDPGGLGEQVEVLHSEERTNYPILVSIDDLGAAGLTITTQVDDLLDPERVNGLLVTALRELTAALAADDPAAAVSDLDVLPTAERSLLLQEFNDTVGPAEADACVHELFQAQASATPDAVAVVHDDAQVTYRDLDAMANRIAHRLRSIGVGPDVRVGLCAQRGVRLIAAMLGVLKAGGAYVPLDPSYPAERVAFMLTDARPAVVLIDGTTPTTDDVPVLDLATDFGDGPDTDLPHVAASALPSDTAYILYTSGSTGTPKGVTVEHRNTVNFLRWARSAFATEVLDRTLWSTSVNFDLAVFEVFLPLVTGRTVVAVRDALAVRADTTDVTLVNTVPSAIAALADAREIPDAVRTINLAGEPLKRDLVDRVFAAADGVEEVRNLYGPSETTTYSTAVVMRRATGFVPHVGGPIGNTRLYVVDGYGRPTPVGVVGELFIGGRGVTRGYLGRPGLTAERFVPDWLTGDGSRLYRTGDLGRWLPDGTLEFVGRNDFQVKVRGYRIELGEIEARLLEHDAVREAVVVARGDRLNAYYVPVPDQGDHGVDVESLRAALSGALPSYMVPSAFVQLDALPLTPNGKVDRDRLPVPDSGAVVARGYQAPVGVVEEVLAAIWADLLDVERVGRDDDFFELGGHSLLAVSLVERMREAGLSCDVRAVFTTPTVAGLAAAVAAGGGADLVVPPNAIPADTDVIAPEMLPLVELTEEQIAQVVSAVPGGAGNVQDLYPLTPLQEGIFYHHLMGGEGDAYVLSSVSAVPSREWVGEFADALQTVVDRHDILRTSVVREGLPHPVQVVWRQADAPVEEVTLDADEDAVTQLRARFDPRRYRLDLEQAPLLRVVTAYDEPNDRWLLMVLMHHLIGDHTTLDVVQKEIGSLLTGRTDALPEPVPYRNVVAQAVLGTSREEHQKFFTSLLGEVDEPTAPYGLLDVRGDGSGIAEAHVDLDPALARTVREQARRAGVSSASVCHLAWSMVLSRLTGRSDVVFGTVMFGRMQAGTGADRGLGLFINTLPVRLDVGARGVLDAVRDTHGLLAEVLRHEHAPLVLAQGCSQVPAGLPLFTSLLNYRHSTPADPAAADAAMSGVEVLHSEERTNYPVVVSVDDLGVGDAGFGITAQVDDRLDPEQVCGLLTAALRELAEALADDPALSVSDVEVVPAAERALLVDGFNPVDTSADPKLCLHETFEAQATATPDAVALVHRDTQVTYRGLNEQANRIAHRLRAAGVSPGVRVGICAERGVGLLAAVVGVLKAGGAYVPLDPSYPAERVAFMLADAKPMVVLTDGADAAALIRATAPEDAVVWDLATDFADAPVGNVPVAVSPADVAYVIYTSGSTGTPKGVLVEHRQVARLFTATEEWFGFGPSDVWALCHSYAFDFSVWEIWGALLHGGQLVVVPSDVVRAPDELWQLVCAAGVTVLCQTPGAFTRLTDARLRTPDTKDQLRFVIFGGEALEVAALRPWFDAAAGGGPTLVNMYGITETTVHVTWQPIEPDMAGGLGGSLIGQPIPDLNVYVVDAHGRPAPVGVVGELMVGGRGVTRGYLGRPALTAERFVPNWLTGDGTRLYRTGDLGRWLPDGTLEYIGRNDFQVKVRGYRIELGEIEARLLDHDAVRQAVVVARGDRLDAYYVPTSSIEIETLRDALAEALPSYMVPSAFVELDALPLTPNGKVDRDKLPAPDGGAVVARGYQAPVGPVEETLAAIWADLLGVERVGRNDDFFELGGHSLLAVSLVEQMRQAGLSCDVRAVFTSPTVAGLATAVAAGGGTEVQVPPNAIPAGADTITPEMLPLVELTEDHITQVVSTVPGGAANVQDIYPLAPLQEGIFFHHLMGGDADPYLVSYVLPIETRDEADRFVAALQAVVDRHDILRTSVVWEGLPQAVQVVRRHTDLPVEDATLDADDDAATQLLKRYDPRRYRMDLGTAPLMRVVRAYDEPNDRWLLLVLMHHIIDDNTSVGTLVSEVDAHLAGRADALPEPVPYRNAVAQAVLGTSREEHERFFTELIGDIDEPTAPYGIHDVRGDGTGIAEAHVDVDPALARTVREQARRAGVSSASVCHLAWSMVLSRLTGRSDVVFGTVMFGRMQAGAGAARGLGLFINTLPIRIDVTERGVLDAARDTQRLLAEMLRHEHAPLVLAQGRSQVPTGLPLFTTLLNYRHSPEPAEPVTGGLGERVEVLHSEERTNYPVVVSVDDLGSGDAGFGITAQVDDQLDPDRICGMLIAALEELSRALADDRSAPVADVEVLPAAERSLLVDGFNTTDTSADPKLCLHETFEAQATATPGAVALVHRDTQVTYRELNERANRIAHRLRAQGVGPGVRVGICAERGVGLLAAVVGVLKAGGAYVPLDPSYPAERVAFMLTDAKPAVVLTDGAEPAALIRATAPEDTVVWDLATDFTDAPAGNVPVTVSPSDVAYVIYTSGSTGTPKGVLVEHRQVARLFTAADEWFGFGPSDVWALCHSYAFDFSVWEIWGALLHGGQLVIVPSDVVRAPDELWQLICSAGVTVFCQTPGAFTRLTDARLRTPDTKDQLRFVIFGGEALEVAALRPWFDAAAGGGPTLVNMYGITETTVHVTWQPIEPEMVGGLGGSLIGQPIPDLNVYVVDTHGRPAPVGVTGELMVGGRGVTRGYLGRPGLTAERFVPNWLTGDGSRLYRTGDLGRWLADGTLEYIGRNDFQVKVRGYRIELGEIEARLLDHDTIREATVIARDDRLNAYYVADTRIDAATLRDALGKVLPSYMVPSAFVALDALPLTPNGKVDRDKLPAPDGDAVVARGYEAPVGAVEEGLAAIWADLLGVEQVGRNDDFFELGGHSLLAVSLVERMREAGLTCDIRAVFTTPTITGLATAVGAGGGTDLVVPPNAIPAGAEAITPDMLPLVELTQEHIDTVAASVLGGASNVQDIYPLGPLQEGIFFHHLMGGEGDAYLLSSVSAVPSREWVGEITDALQTVVNRHDILRTAVVWEGLPQPLQVVWCHADLPVEEVTLDVDEDGATQLLTRYDPRRYRMDLRAAPLLRVVTAYDARRERWLVMMLMHHLVGDHTTLEMLQEEVGAVLAGRASALPEPVPYRNAVAQAVLGTSREEHEKFFTDQLGDIDEPTAPYGILDVRGDGTGIAEAHAAIEPELAETVREQARQAGVSPASMCHLAWSMVLSRLTGRSDVVFGTVLFGRMQAGAGAERGLGLFINTLPIRVDVDARGVLDAVRDTHGLLAEVLRHEHAPLVLAQGCSQVPPGSPLFTSLFNYRHSTPADPAATDAAMSEFEVLHNEERTNYPVVVSVDDLGAENTGFAITAQVDDRLDPERVCVLLTAALRELTGLLASDPTGSVADVEVLPAPERTLVVEGFNATEAPLDATARVHGLFEAHAKTAPDAVAVVHGDTQLTYRDLNAKANQIAHRLRSAGVGPDVRVGISARRGVPLLAAMLGVLKAGGAYVPLDPSYPAERLAFMLADAQPAVILTDGTDLPTADMPVIDLASLTDEPDTDLPNLAASTDMAYVLYTSGSTGLPKGVAVEHRNIVRLVVNNPSVEFTPQDRTAFAANPSFDAATWEIWGPLTNGGTIVVIDQDDVLDPQRFAGVLQAQSVSMLWMTVGLFNRSHTALGDVLSQLRYLVVGGDVLDPSAIAATVGGPQHLLNGYGPTETTTFAATHLIETVDTARSVPIGKPIGNTRIYLVDGYGRPVPVGVTGELFIGGLGVARGYLGRPGLTAERFVPDWLTGDGTRLYRTGDLGRWLPDGTIEFVGRNDFQVKVRGYRIELGEIEARLLEHDAVREAIVIARGDRIDAYYVPDNSIEVETLRDALSEVLPSYMVPSAFVALDALPLTPNGKVDRDKLPAPGDDAVVARGYQAPIGAVEEALAAIWADLLGVERIGRNDDFFELGGHSLLAVSLVERMREAGLTCDVRAVFTTPTIAGLATAVAAGGSAEVSVPPNLIPDVHRSEADGGGKMEIDL
ncbi:non-ribosomal peptide synthetase [Streptomyces sp. RTd22]|uniref:non-ribosomal peptide synthetase n=1 Tax=Streptomyces sp. RTd22 TaxID=1841249 RepID=UPI0007D9CCE7|nr:non-ribosomal peptide synthetase [Streptomyces sp. RTd22]